MIMFAQTREDPEIEVKILNDLYVKLKRPLNVLMLTSGGESVLRLSQLDIVNSIIAIDANPLQNELCQKKSHLLLSLGPIEYQKNIFSPNGLCLVGVFESLFQVLSNEVKQQFKINNWRDLNIRELESMEMKFIFEKVFERNILRSKFGARAVDYSMDKEFSVHFYEVFTNALMWYRNQGNYFIDSIFESKYFKDKPQYLNNYQDKLAKVNFEVGYLQEFLSNKQISFDLIQTSNITDWMPGNELKIFFELVKKNLSLDGVICARRLNGDHCLSDEVAKVFQTDKLINEKYRKNDKSFFYSEVVVGRNE